MELNSDMDEITPSIEDAKTGERLKTLILPLDKAELEHINRKNGWLFDWKKELVLLGRNVYKLVTEKEPDVIQGLVSVVKDKTFVLMPLIENAPFNRGRGKKYLDVCPNMTAYGCKLSREYGFGGVVAFNPKTELFSHFEKTLGAVRISNSRMAIFEYNAKLLLDKFFPEKEKTL
jgi:hypothetical protein